MIEVWYDGACEPVNPGGHGGGGWLIKKDGLMIASGQHYIPANFDVSNNVAEYTGMIWALKWLIDCKMQNERIAVYGDNMMSVMQMAGEWRAKKGFYLPLYEEAKSLRNKFKKISFKWIPREKNGEADELSKSALKAQGVHFRIQTNV